MGMWFGCTFHTPSDNPPCQVEKKLLATDHILRRTTVWELAIINSTLWGRNRGKLNVPTGMKKKKWYNTWKIHSHKKRLLSPSKHRQQRSQTESSSKTAKRWTLNKLGVDSLWVSPLWGTQHTSWVPSESEQSAAIHHLKAQGQSSTGPQTCDQLSHTTIITISPVRAKDWDIDSELSYFLWLHNGKCLNKLSHFIYTDDTLLWHRNRCVRCL